MSGITTYIHTTNAGLPITKGQPPPVIYRKAGQTSYNNKLEHHLFLLDFPFPFFSSLAFSSSFFFLAAIFLSLRQTIVRPQLKRPFFGGLAHVLQKKSPLTIQIIF